MNWTKMEPLPPEGIFCGCLACSTAASVAPLEMKLCVGFGDVRVTKDGECIWAEEPYVDLEDAPDVAHFEKIAAADPDHDWRIARNTPLHGETFQRHGAGQWVCVESDKGFA